MSSLPIEERRKIGRAGVKVFIDRAKRYFAGTKLKVKQTKGQFAPFDVEIYNDGVLVGMVEVKHRPNWNGITFPYSSIRIDYQKVEKAVTLKIPVIFVMFSNKGEDLRYYFNISRIKSTQKPTQAGGWGPHYELLMEEFGDNNKQFWLTLIHLLG